MKFDQMAWKELRQIIIEYQRSDGPFAQATLVKSSGSTYRQPGSRMLILQGRPFIGPLSAGCIEEEIADLAQGVILYGKPSRCSFDLRSRFACDGSIEVFIERLVKSNAFLDGLIGVLGNRTPIKVSTNYRLADAVPGTRLIDVPLADHAEEFVQEIQPPIRLIIFGDYFDVKAVAYLGWQVEVVTDAHELSAGDARTAYVVMSHHFGRDIAALKHVFAGNYGYVGLLGPRRRKQLLMSHLIDEGYPPKSVSTLYTPAGLDIGSETAEEIAVAIIAEVQAALTGRTGRSLRERGCTDPHVGGTYILRRTAIVVLAAGGSRRLNRSNCCQYLVNPCSGGS
jgi:xanthine dehydrogenase accessory factor